MKKLDQLLAEATAGPLTITEAQDGSGDILIQGQEAYEVAAIKGPIGEWPDQINARLLCLGRNHIKALVTALEEATRNFDDFKPNALKEMGLDLCNETICAALAAIEKELGHDKIQRA